MAVPTEEAGEVSVEVEEATTKETNKKVKEATMPSTEIKLHMKAKEEVVVALAETSITMTERNQKVVETSKMRFKM